MQIQEVFEVEAAPAAVWPFFGYLDHVRSTGSVVLEGRAQDLLEDEAVGKEYLG